MCARDQAWAENAFEERDAGLWLKQNAGSRPNVLSAIYRPVFYAEGDQTMPTVETAANAESVLRQMKERNAGYVLVSERSLKRNPFLKNLPAILRESPCFELVYRKNEQPGYEILIFKLKEG